MYLSSYVGTGMVVGKVMFINFCNHKALSHHMMLLIATTTPMKTPTSHRNHRGNVCGVDFVWLRNPRLWPTPLKKGYMEAIFGNLVQILLKVSKEGSDPPNLFECDGGNITYSQFSEGLTKLGLCVSDMEIKQLWEKLDPDRDGLVELSGFDELTQRQQTPLHQEDENEQIGAAMNPTVKVPSVKSTISFNIERAMLYPPEVEKGIWPEGYSLSDHALLSWFKFHLLLHPF